MQQPRNIRFDVASAISQGQRPYQEDALVADFPLGAPVGFVVLADGMGGHAAGDVASKIVVTEVFSELKFQSGDTDAFYSNLPSILRDAAMSANECVKVHIQGNMETAGMGATLIAPVFIGRSLFWISVGDSPLLLYRDGILRQLNEDHSMAPQIDFMIRSGMMAEDVGRNHPDRSCLTSVLGGEQIARIDCPTEPFDVQNGDVFIAASDGIQYLNGDEITAILDNLGNQSSQVIADRLLRDLETHGDPEQDNASFSVIKVSFEDAARHQRKERRKKQTADALQDPAAELAVASAPSRARSGILFRSASFFRGSTQ